MEDTFTIPASLEDFVSWLDGHIRRTLEAWKRAEVITWPDRTTVEVTALGAVIAFILQDEDESTVTMRAELRIDPNPDAAQWLAGTMDAIRRKWPQKEKEKPGPKPLTDEELCQIAALFHESGQSQAVFCGLQHVSPHTLQKALKLYKAHQC